MNTADELRKPPQGDWLVTIKRADGSTYQAAFGGKFYIGFGEPIASIARWTDFGWSHGCLGKDETILNAVNE